MAGTGMLSLLILSLLVSQATPLYLLNRLGYIKLPGYDIHTNHAVYSLFSGTAEESAYDPEQQLLYVVGEESYVLHIIDISDPTIPHILTEHRFLQTDGVPRDVEVCNGKVAVSLSSPAVVYNGHVKFFSYDKTTQTLTYESELPVGVHPDNIEFTKKCDKLLVANEGVHGKDPFGHYTDPEGSVSVITIPKVGSPSEIVASFNSFNDRTNIRHVSKAAPNTDVQMASLAQDIEPEYISISEDGRTAYITLQENNAIAELNLGTGVVTKVDSLGDVELINYQMDASDLDGGIHLRSYPVHGLYQPDGIDQFQIGNKKYLVTVNEGSVRTYTKKLDGFVWSDGDLANTFERRNLLNKIEINNDTFVTELRTNSKLGRLLVSKIDGQTPYGIGKIHTYGTRGFSIWEAGKYDAPIYDSGDAIEKINADVFKNIFNTDCASWTQNSPETLKDSTSDNMGPKLNALDVVNDNGTIFIAMGSETMGTVYLYTFNTTSMMPELQNVKHDGGTSDLWSELYDNDQAGNAYITDIKIIPAAQSPTNDTLLYVVGGASGSVGIYKISETSS